MSGVGIVCALEREALLVPRNGDVVVRVSGPGPERARAAAEERIEAGARALVTIGLAGGLDPALPAGALVIAARAIGPDGTPVELDAAWVDRLRALLPEAMAATVATLEEPVGSTGAKAALHRATGAVACDLETAAVADAARAAGVPVAGLRVVCDPAGTALPRASRAALDGRGRVRGARVAAGLLRRPGELPALLRLGRAERTARSALAAALTRAWPALVAPPGVPRLGAAS